MSDSTRAILGDLTPASSALVGHQDISGKADKATTLAGYGITDAKIESGMITLGQATITPLTSHQDISGKADKATTLSGYGITDAKIENGTITLGGNSVTPLTSHQELRYALVSPQPVNGVVTLQDRAVNTVAVQHVSETAYLDDYLMVSIAGSVGFNGANSVTLQLTPEGEALYGVFSYTADWAFSFWEEGMDRVEYTLDSAPSSLATGRGFPVLLNGATLYVPVDQNSSFMPDQATVGPVQVSVESGSVTSIVPPTAVQGRSRGFLLRLSIAAGASAPTLSFTGCTFEPTAPSLADGSLVQFKEVEAGRFLVTEPKKFLTSHQDISGKENVTNKVTSISAQSTDVQYPSAKCVWDNLRYALADASVTTVNSGTEFTYAWDSGANPNETYSFTASYSNGTWTFLDLYSSTPGSKCTATVDEAEDVSSLTFTATDTGWGDPWTVTATRVPAAQVTLADRTVNAVTLTGNVSGVSLVFPEAVQGRARDFLLRLTLAAGVASPQLSSPQGVTFENAAGSLPVVASASGTAATTLFMFAETKAASAGADARFLVEGKELKEIT